MPNRIDKLEDPLLKSLLHEAIRACDELPRDRPTTEIQAINIYQILGHIRLHRIGFHNFHPGPENSCILDAHRTSAKAIVSGGDTKVAELQSDILECAKVWSTLMEQVEQAA